MEIKKLKIKEFAEVISGSTPKTNIEEYWNGEFSWITPAEIKEDSKYIFNTSRTLTKEGINSCSLRELRKNTVLLTSRAPIGKVAIVGKAMYCNQGFKNLICNENIVNPEYIYYWLSSQTEYLNSLGRGATFKEISKKIVEDIEIPIPELDNQNKIVEILKKSEKLIDKRKEQIEALDELVKSQFIEMFGDPVINPYNWNKEELGIICDVRDGTHDSPQYVSEGYPLITSKNIINGIVDFQNVNYISKEDLDSINKRSKVDNGDIIMPMIGTIGNPVIVNSDKEFAIKNVALIKFNENSLITNIFVRTLLESHYFEYVISQNKRGGTQKFISLGDIRKLKVIVPPVKLQNQFASFIKQVDKLKFEMEKSLKELEDNFSSLMQKAFSGELFN